MNTGKTKPSKASHSHSAKVWVVMSVCSMVLILIGHAIQSRFGLLIGFFLAVSLNSLVFFYADLRLDSLFPSQILEGRDAWGILNLVRDLSKKIGVEPPMIHVIDSATPLAFSAGLLPKRSSVFISSALLERMSENEIKIILAYELHRLSTQQTAAATAVSALAGLLSFTAKTLDDILLLRFITFMFRRKQRGEVSLLKHGGVRLGPFTLLISPFVALLVRSSVSREAIIASDRFTADLIGDKLLVARTLWKLDSYAKTKPFPVNLAEAHLFMVSPLVRYPMWRFAVAQPPIERRLFHLTGHEPL
jgi:Zn-dependent protease with chaperone function